MPTLSIIIPSYNHARFLNKRLQSILNQTYTDWELIIIDDYSSDSSLEILSEFAKNNPSKIKYFISHESNSGSGYFSWQKGIELAQTKYIWIAETDDYSEPTFLEELIEVLEKNENTSLAFCVSNYVENDIIIYDSTRRTKDLNVEENSFKIISSQLFLSKMPLETYITNASSVVFKKPTEPISKEIFCNKQSSDLFLWTLLVQNHSVAFLNKKLNYFRRHQDSTTVKMNATSLKNIYVEKVKYLNYFNQQYKVQVLIDHYIKHFVWNNKKEVLKYDFLKNLKGNHSIERKYYLTLLKFIFIKFKTLWS